MKYENVVIKVSNYATDWLDDKLKRCGELGYKLVNVVMAKNEYNCDTMYLFFTKEIVDAGKC